MNYPRIEAIKKILSKANSLLENREVKRSQFKKSAEYLKKSLSFYQKETPAEMKIGNAFEEFIFAFFELESVVSGTDYLTLNFSEEEESSSEGEEEEGSEEGDSENENCINIMNSGKKFEIYTVKEVSSKDEDDTPMHGDGRVSLREAFSKTGSLLERHSSKKSSRLTKSGNYSLIIESFKTPDHNTHRERIASKSNSDIKEFSKSEQTTLKKVSLSKREVYDVNNLVQNIYIDFKGDTSDIKLVSNESSTTIKNNGAREMNKQPSEDIYKTVSAKKNHKRVKSKDKIIVENHQDSPSKEDKSFSVSFIDFDKISYCKDPSSPDKLFSRSRLSSCKDSNQQLELPLSSEKLLKRRRGGSRRSNYQKKRLNFIQSDGEDEGSSSLSPPLDFKTKRYSQRKSYLEPSQSKNSQQNGNLFLKQNFKSDPKLENRNTNVKILDSSMEIYNEKCPPVIIRSEMKKSPNEVLKSFINKTSDEKSTIDKIRVILKPYEDKKKSVTGSVRSGKEMLGRRSIHCNGYLRSEISKLGNLSSKQSKGNLSTERLKELEIDLISTRDYVNKVKNNLTILKGISNRPKKFEISYNKEKRSNFSLETPEKKAPRISLLTKFLSSDAFVTRDRGSVASHKSRIQGSGSSIDYIKKEIRSRRMSNKKLRKSSKVSRIFIKKFSSFYNNYKKKKMLRTQSRSSSRDSLLDLSIESFKIKSKTISAKSKRYSSKLIIRPKTQLRARRRKKVSLSIIDPRLAKTEVKEGEREKKNLSFFLRNRRKNVISINTATTAKSTTTRNGKKKKTKQTASFFEQRTKSFKVGKQMLTGDSGREDKLVSKMLDLIEEFGYNTSR